MNWRGFKHWVLPDHVSFILLFLALVFQQWILAMILYWFTFLYDVAEEQIEVLKKLELWAKSTKVHAVNTI